VVIAALAAAEAAGGPVSDKERAEADALAVLSSAVRELESAEGTERALEERLATWCERALLGQRSLLDEVDRELSEQETSARQLAADEERLESTTRLAVAGMNATQRQETAAGAEQQMLGVDVAGELQLLQEAQELATHALRLVSNRRGLPLDDEAAAAANTGPELTALLQDLLTEVDQQKQAVQDESESAATLFANLSTMASRAGSALQDQQTTVRVEGRERARARARIASTSADLRRLVNAASDAVNASRVVCDAAQSSTEGRAGVVAAELDAMHTVLDQISPDLNPAPTFTQLFLSRRDAPRQVGIVEQFRDFAARMSRQSTYASPAFAKTAQNLGEGSAALVVKAATVKKPAKDDPLAEIADFATGDKEDSSGDIEVARDAYRRLVADLKKQITTAIVEGQECESAENNATVDQHLRNNDAAFAEAQLGALNTTTGDLNKTAVYFDTQLKALHKDFADFDALVKLEGEQYTKLSKDLQSFTQQMLSVATELAGVGDKKVGKEVEAIVERLQQHLSAVSYRHDMYARWKSTVSDGTTGLQRVLTIDLGHAKHKLKSYSTDMVFLAAMKRAKKRDEVFANEQIAKIAARCPPEKDAVRRTRQAALQDQLHELMGFWTSLHI
jgi:hypothetical protein